MKRFDQCLGLKLGNSEKLKGVKGVIFYLLCSTLSRVFRESHIVESSTSNVSR